mmetsp:Transcript_4729/g.11312  ORF Transcript_4729/g.11312 Transcript_4729/m.11312 type:complete len:207 (-) Transcript_4729:1110-1730(-)
MRRHLGLVQWQPPLSHDHEGDPQTPASRGRFAVDCSIVGILVGLFSDCDCCGGRRHQNTADPAGNEQQHRQGGCYPHQGAGTTIVSDTQGWKLELLVLGAQIRIENRTEDTRCQVIGRLLWIHRRLAKHRGHQVNSSRNPNCGFSRRFGNLEEKYRFFGPVDTACLRRCGLHGHVGGRSRTRRTRASVERICQGQTRWPVTRKGRH